MHPSEVHANLGWIWEGEGADAIADIARDRKTKGLPLINTDNTDQKWGRERLIVLLAFSVTSALVLSPINSDAGGPGCQGKTCSPVVVRFQGEDLTWQNPRMKR